MTSEESPRSSRGVERTGFTMLEILSVLFVIGTLVGLLLPAIQASREAARRASCGNNLAQIGFAVHAYQISFEVLPAGTISEVLPVENYPNGYHHSWLVRILPMLGQQPLFEQVDWRFSCYDPANWPVVMTGREVMQCPSDWVYGPEVAISGYAGVFDGRIRPIDEESRGLLIANRFLTRDDVPDGFAYTLLAGDKTIIDSTEPDSGWMSGTRATLRTTGYAPGEEARKFGESSGSDYSTNPKVTLTPYGQYLGDTEFDPTTAEDEEVVEEEPVPDDSQWGPMGLDWGQAGDDEFSIEPTVNQFPAPLPRDERTRPGGFDSRHDSGGANMLWGDGRVGFVSELVDPKTYAQMGMRDDAMPIKPLLDE